MVMIICPEQGAYVFHDPGCIVLDLGVDARVMGKGTAHAKARVSRQDKIFKIMCMQSFSYEQSPNKKV